MVCWVQMGKMRSALTPSAEMLLQKGRRLTEHTLDTCQLKRVKAAAVNHAQPNTPACFRLYFALERGQSDCDVCGDGMRLVLPLRQPCQECLWGKGEGRGWLCTALSGKSGLPDSVVRCRGRAGDPGRGG